MIIIIISLISDVIIIVIVIYYAGPRAARCRRRGDAGEDLLSGISLLVTVVFKHKLTILKLMNI